MIDIRRFLNETYLYNRLSKKDIFYLSIIVILIVFFKFSMIIWWGVVILCFWIASKFFSIKKKHVEEEEMDEYCKGSTFNPKCILYQSSKKNYKNIIKNISGNLS